MNPLTWIKTNLMEGAAILGAVLLVIVTISFSVKLGEKARDLAAMTKDRDGLHTAIYAEQTGWAARLNQCQTNTATLNAALASQNDAVAALKAQGDAKARAADQAVQEARKAADGYRATVARISAAQGDGRPLHRRWRSVAHHPGGRPMRTALTLLAVLALAGCKTVSAAPPEPVIITKTVNVPVPVPCPVKLPPEKPLPSRAADLAVLDTFDLSKLALQDRAELQAELVEWMAAAKACATEPGP